MAYKITLAGEHLRNFDEKSIYLNPAASNFINDNDVIALSATRGMGKTTLLRYKRYLLDSHNSILTIPRRTHVDYVRLPSSEHLRNRKAFYDFRFWQELWEVSIAISVLLNDDPNLHLPKLLSIQSIKNEKKSILYYKHPAPSDILSALLFLQPSRLYRFLSEALPVLSATLRNINRAIAVFIDSINPISSEPENDIMVAAQHGLLSAAYSIRRSNNHLKVFCCLDISSDKAINFRSRPKFQRSVIRLSYTKNDLRKIIEQLLNIHANISDTSEILDKTLQNAFGCAETVFDYIFRHSFGSPRDVIGIFGELVRIPNIWENTSLIRKTVKEFSAEVIVRDYLVNISHHLTCFDSEQELLAFIALLPSNVFKRSEIGKIFQLGTTQYSSPQAVLKELYNVGLVGVVEKDITTNKNYQHFILADGIMSGSEGTFPVSPFYFLHPSLVSVSYLLNKNLSISREFMIGNGYPWEDEYEKEIIQKKLKIFISYSIKDGKVVGNFVKSLIGHLERRSVLHDIWWDKWKIKSGELIQQAIETGIEDSDFLVIVLSESSIKSGWVEREWRRKFGVEIDEAKISVIPVLIEELPLNSIPALLRDKLIRQVIKNGRLNGHIMGQLVNDLIALGF